MLRAITLAAALLLAGCEPPTPERFTEPLEALGFTHIHLSPSPFTFACGDSDLFAQAFTARSERGRQVAGHVCCGILKGCTVRF